MASGRCTVATRVADRCNADKHAVQKESEPRAFAVPRRPDSIDAVVPIALQARVLQTEIEERKKLETALRSAHTRCFTREVATR